MNNSFILILFFDLKRRVKIIFVLELEEFRRKLMQGGPITKDDFPRDDIEKRFDEYNKPPKKL